MTILSGAEVQERLSIPALPRLRAKRFPQRAALRSDKGFHL
jgi:hypothetical protein